MQCSDTDISLYFLKVLIVINFFPIILNPRMRITQLLVQLINNFDPSVFNLSFFKKFSLGGEFHTSERNWENEMVIILIGNCPTAILWNEIKEAFLKLMLRENTMVLFPYF